MDIAAETVGEAISLHQRQQQLEEEEVDENDNIEVMEDGRPAETTQVKEGNTSNNNNSSSEIEDTDSSSSSSSKRKGGRKEEAERAEEDDSSREIAEEASNLVNAGSNVNSSTSNGSSNDSVPVNSGNSEGDSTKGSKKDQRDYIYILQRYKQQPGDPTPPKPKILRVKRPIKLETVKKGFNVENPALYDVQTKKIYQPGENGMFPIPNDVRQVFLAKPRTSANLEDRSSSSKASSSATSSSATTTTTTTNVAPSLYAAVAAKPPNQQMVKTATITSKLTVAEGRDPGAGAATTNKKTTLLPLMPTSSPYPTPSTSSFSFSSPTVNNNTNVPSKATASTVATTPPTTVPVVRPSPAPSSSSSVRPSPNPYYLPPDTFVNMPTFQPDDDDASEEEDDFEILDIKNLPDYATAISETFPPQKPVWMSGIETIAGVVQEQASYLLKQTNDVVQAAYSNVRNPFNNYYTVMEQEQMRAVQSAYRRCYNTEDLPMELQMDTSSLRPLYAASASPSNFKKEVWMKKFGSGLLRSNAEEMIAIICNYQEDRYSRKNGGYVDDPRNLVLEQLKDWISNKLSKMQPNKELLLEVENTSNYLNELLDPSLFRSGYTSQITMQQTLLFLRNILQSVVSPIIEQEIKNISVRELLENLIKDTKNALYHGLTFSLHVLSDVSIPTDITLDRIRNPDSQSFREVTGTEAGKLLQSLIKQPWVSNVFFPNPNVAPTSTTPVMQSITGTGAGNSDPNLGGKNAFALVGKNHRENSVANGGAMAGFDRETFPSVALLQWKPDGSVVEYLKMDSGNKNKERLLPLVEGSTVFTGRYASNNTPCRTGICRAFYQEQLLANLVEMHVLLYELAGFLGLIQQAKGLSGLGGELLVFGFSNAQVERLFTQFGVLTEALLDRMQALEKAAQVHQGNLIRQKSIGDHGWIKNYSIAMQQYNAIKIELSNASDIASKIQKLASTSLKDRLQHVQEATEKFANDAANFNLNIQAVLQCFDSNRHPSPAITN